MISSPFEIILKEFEPFFNCHLVTDRNQSCLIKMGIGVSIQIELDREGFVLVGCRLGPLLPGNYRALLMKQALKSNANTAPSTGIFGFSLKSGYIILYLRLNPDEVNIQKIEELMPPFIEKGRVWQEALKREEVPAVVEDISHRATPSLFNIRL